MKWLAVIGVCVIGYLLYIGVTTCLKNYFKNRRLNDTRTRRNVGNDLEK